MVLGQTADEQIDIVDAAELLLQMGRHRGIAGDPTEIRIGLQIERHASLVERADAEIAFTLDVDGDEVHVIRRRRQKVAQFIDRIHVVGLRLVTQDAAQQAIDAAVGLHLGRRIEERVRQTL